LKDFIVSAKYDADKLKGLKIANDNDIAEVSANIKELNADQETLTPNASNIGYCFNCNINTSIFH
jgi:hypothetical protein